MKGLKIALIMILSSLAIWLCIVMVWMINGKNAFAFWGGGGWGQPYLQNTTTVDMDGIKEVKIDYGKTPFDIEFLPGDGEELILEEYFSKEVEQEKMASVNVSGDRVSVQQRYRTGNNLLYTDNTQGYVKVYIPAEAYERLTKLEAGSTSGDISLLRWDNVKDMSMKEVKLTTTSGDIWVSYMEAKDVSLTSTSGEIEVEKLKGNLIISSTSGDLEIGELKGNLNMSGTSGDQSVGYMNGIAMMNSTSGDLEMKELKGDGIFHSTSGYVTVVIDKINGDISASTTSGDIDMEIPDGISFRFQAKTTSGDISTSFDDSITYNKKGNSAEGTVGAKADHAIEITSTSGDVTVR